VGGDAIDLAFLGAAFMSPNAKQGWVVAATAAVVGVTIPDVVCVQQLSRNGPSGRDVHHKKNAIISRSPEELYRFWHDVQNLPRFMEHLQSVQLTAMAGRIGRQGSGCSTTRRAVCWVRRALSFSAKSRDSKFRMT
jgi:hypothetical protein